LVFDEIMSETWLGTIPAIQAIILIIGCWFYMSGGRSGKWKRRFIGSFICATALWVGLLLMGLFNPLSLLAYPLLIWGFCMGYGAEIPLTKVIKRLNIVLAVSSTGLLMCLILGGNAWVILPLQLLIAGGSIWLGVKNPLQAAPEEFFVCLLLTECLIMYPAVRAIF